MEKMGYLLRGVTVISFAFLLGACGSDNVGGSQGPVIDPTESEVYVGIKVQAVAPQALGRAVYDNGDADGKEYAVNNAMLVVFKSADSDVATAEENATYVTKAPLTSGAWTSAQTSGISSAASATAKLDLSDVSSSDNLFALIVLNYKESDASATDKALTLPSTTFKAWKEAAQSNVTMVDGNYLTMTNAVKYSADGKHTTLVAIDRSAIAASASAVAKPAATVYVQRNVAKVTVQTQSSYTFSNGTYTVTGWGIDNYNSSSYPVQRFDGLATDFTDIWSTARFFDDTASFPRIFWAIDPNYKDATTALTRMANLPVSSPTAAYCLENTFSLDNQKHNAMTAVVIAGTYVPQGFSSGDSFVKIADKSQLWKVADLKIAIEAAATAANGSEVTVTMPTTGGSYSVAELTFSTTLDATKQAAVAKALGLASASEKGIAVYENGKNYYNIPIKHFNAETPWTANESTSDPYNGDNAKYLGRYGVVRNNWYDVTVNAVNSIGSPALPELKDGWVDTEAENAVEVSISILAWAKRSQVEDL